MIGVKKIMRTEDFKILENICSMKEKELYRFVKTFLMSLPFNSFNEGKNYFIAWGGLDIALVAHLDTVFDFPPQELFYDRDKDTILTLGQGAGFDDRAGVYAILKILTEWKDVPPTIIFTLGEEDYGVGAREAASDGLKEKAKRLKYMIELDRQGKDDCVFYQCISRDFQSYVSSFGFKKQPGSYSDIYFLMDEWQTCGVNLSIGYYDEHTDYEYLRPSQMEVTIIRVLKMLKDIKNVSRFRYKRVVACNCDRCGQPSELIDVNTINGHKRYCINCLVEACNYCSNCEQLISMEDTNFCPVCGKELV